MPILTDAQRTALKSELQKPQYRGLRADQVAPLLNAPSQVANPISQANSLLARPISMSDVIGGLSPASLSKVLSLPAAAAIVERINAQDHSAIGLWIQVLAGAAQITPAESTAIQNLLASKVPDPNWSPTVKSGPSVKQALFGRATWTLPTGESVDYLTPAAVLEALN